MSLSSYSAWLRKSDKCVVGTKFVGSVCVRAQDECAVIRRQCVRVRDCSQRVIVELESCEQARGVRDSWVGAIEDLSKGVLLISTDSTMLMRYTPGYERNIFAVVGITWGDVWKLVCCESDPVNRRSKSHCLRRNWDQPFEIMCDASDYAIGAVLGQRIEKHFRPIHYASKTMTEAETNYTTTEKEMLAVVYAFEKFSIYLIMIK
ncbi:reverse transcriptase domain-containing protein [Tanacetum coccineum]